jgi:hypothetical protein
MLIRLRLLQRDPAFSSFSSSFDYDVTSRRGKQVTVARGIERSELGSEEETDYATTE